MTNEQRELIQTTIGNLNARAEALRGLVASDERILWWPQYALAYAVGNGKGTVCGVESATTFPRDADMPRGVRNGSGQSAVAGSRGEAARVALANLNNTIAALRSALAEMGDA